MTRVKEKGLKALARNVFGKSEPSINTVAEKQDFSIYMYNAFANYEFLRGFFQMTN